MLLGFGLYVVTLEIICSYNWGLWQSQDFLKKTLFFDKLSDNKYGFITKICYFGRTRQLLTLLRDVV